MPAEKDNLDKVVGRLRQAAGRPTGPWRILAVFVAVVVAAKLLPEGTAFGIIVLATFLANAGRIGIHIWLGGYLWLKSAKIQASPKPQVRRHLSVLVIADIALTVLGLLWGAMLLIEPDAALAWRAIPAFVLCFAVYVVALATVDRAGELELERGTELVRSSRFGGWLFKIGRAGTGFKPVKVLIDLFDDPTPTGQPSTLAILIAAALLFVSVASLGAKLGHTAKMAATTELRTWNDAGKPVREAHGTGEMSNLQVTIGKADSSDPETLIPLSRRDLPYILLALPLVAGVRQQVEASGGQLEGSSLYIPIEKKTTLIVKVIAE